MSFRSGRRDEWLVVAAKSASGLGDLIAVVTLTLRLQANGSGAGSVAALLIANAVPIVALSGVIGRLVDRLDSRTLLVTSSISQAIVCLVLAGVHSPAPMFGLVAVLGAGQAVNSATWQALLATVAPGDELPRAIGRAQAGTTAAAIAAPALAGLLTGAFSTAVPLLVDAAAYGGVTVLAVLIATRRHVVVADGPAARGGFAIVRSDALLAPIFVILGLSVLVGCMVNVVEVFLVRETLHASSTWYGIGGAIYAFGMFGGALFAGRLRGAPAQARTFVLAGTLLGVELALLAAMPSVGWLQPVLFAAGVANGLMNVTLGCLVMTRARDDERGRVSAALSGSVSAMQILAYVAGGALTAVFSPRTVFVLAGVLCAVPPVVLARRLTAAAQDTAPNPRDGSQDYADFSRGWRLGASRGTSVG